VVAKPLGSGVIEEPWRWNVSAELYAATAAYANPQGLSLLAVVHTHLSTRPPRMSVTDRTRGLRVPDALAVIIGSAGAERDIARWGWFAYGADGYDEVAAGRITLTEGPAEYVEIAIGDTS
jgi:proteasome lid subunit RPN8/RPN11